MNLPAAIVLSSLALGAGGVATFLALGPAPSAAPAPQTSSTDGAELVHLRTSIAALYGEIAELRSDRGVVLATPRENIGLTEAQIERAVAAYFEGRGGLGAQAAAPAADVEKVALGSPEELAALLADASGDDAALLWKRIVEEGLDDGLLAHMAALAEANPNDPEVQLALGQAYLGRTQEAGAGPLAGKYATLADQALDAALEADPEHWEARFTKAMALSFWPPILGKQPAAIREFETLVAQQSGVAPTKSHAQTHLMLGTLYQQSGQPEKALEAWKSGLALFPSHAELLEQVKLASGQ